LNIILQVSRFYVFCLIKKRCQPVSVWHLKAYVVNTNQKGLTQNGMVPTFSHKLSKLVFIWGKKNTLC